MRQSIHAAVRDNCLPYLEQVLARATEDRHSRITGLFEAHMGLLADFCMAGYGGRGTLTTEFVRGLHKSLFPRDYKQTTKFPDGEVVSMVPGEYKRFINASESYVYPNRSHAFVAPEDVPETMTQATNTLNAALLAATNERKRRDAILTFVIDFLMIHPFGDANGRMAFLLADLLAVREEWPTFHFQRIKRRDLPALYRAIEQTREQRTLTPLYEVIERYNPAALME